MGERAARELPPVARRLKLEITETAEYLEKSLKRAKSAPQKERLQMLWWLKTGVVSQHQELSQRLGRSPACITRWLCQYRNGGLKQLLSVKTAPGAEPKIGGEVLEKLLARLNSEEGFSSYRAIAEWLKHECGLEVKYNTVNRFVRQKLKAKLKVPRPVSLNQKPGVTTFHNNMAHPDTTQTSHPSNRPSIRGCAMLLRDSVGAIEGFKKTSAKY